MSETLTEGQKVTGEEWKRPMGRPSLYPSHSKLVIESVRKGLTPSRAGQKNGISAETVSDWRSTFPEFAEAITQAEADYLEDRLDAIKRCETKWGTPDPKALELELRRFPEFRQHQVTESTNTTIQLTLDPSQVAQLQGLWAASREKLASAREAITIPG